jgi:hypothetical protein
MNMNKALDRVLDVLEVVFATPIIDHGGRPKLLRRLYRYDKAIERATGGHGENMDFARLPQDQGGVRQDGVGKDKANRRGLRGERHKLDDEAIVDETEEDGSRLYRVEE